MTITHTPGPYEHRGAYVSTSLHFDPLGREWAEFLAEDNNPKTGDGAARSAFPPPWAVAASPNAQPAPSPQAAIGGAR